MELDFQTELDECMARCNAEIEEFQRKQRLRYELRMVLGGWEPYWF